MSSMHPEGWTGEKPSRNGVRLGSVASLYWEQEKFPDKSGRHVLPIRLPPLTEADGTAVRVMVDECKSSTEIPFREPLCDNSPTVFLAGHENRSNSPFKKPGYPKERSKKLGTILPHLIA
jgi:hypothetical protein